MSTRPLDLPPRELVAAYGADIGKLRVAISTLSCSVGTAMAHAFEWLAHTGLEPAVMGVV